MSTAWLGLGSNQNAQANLRAGLAALYRRFDNLAVSPVYRSAAVGFSGQDFLNCAERISTDLSPVQLKQWLTDLEDAHGRDRSQPKFSDRSLDIGILLYDDPVGQLVRLVLPPDEILEYANVLMPLDDLPPDLMHPVSGQTLASHWEAFSADRTLT